MENKEIEEMAKIIKAVKYAPFNDGKPTYIVGNQMQDFVFDLIAEELLKHYRKIPKDSVVLSREEHQKYLAYKIIEPQIKGCLDRERELEKKCFAMAKEQEESCQEGYLDGYEKGKEQARKETAEKIIKFIETLKVKEDGRHQWREDHNDCIDKVILKLNQKFVNGVEIKE